MKIQTKERLTKINKDFEERLKWITARKYKIPERYGEMCNSVRKTYIDFVKDIYISLRKEIRILSKSQKRPSQKTKNPDPKNKQ